MDGRRNLAIDAVALVVYLVAANPALTGVDIHEWVGLGVLLVLLVHCAVHVDWVRSGMTGFKGSTWGARGNLVLDVLILAAFMVVAVSGLGVSGAVLSSMGLYAEGYFFWDPLHSIAAKVLLALLLLHVVVHGRWIIGLIKKGKDTRDE